MLDRRLVRDDGRGLGQGVMDNRPMNVVFHILVESNISTTLSSADGDYNAKLGITILGESVTVEDEIVVINSIVLPNKTFNVSVQEEIIL